jgi:hypothetical protein
MIDMVESSLQVHGSFRAFTVPANRAFVKAGLPNAACLLGISSGPLEGEKNSLPYYNEHD